MKRIFHKIKEYLKKQPYGFLVVVILIVSIVFNLYLLEQSNWLNKLNNKEKVNNNTQVVHNIKTTELKAPWGVRTEVYTKYENGKWKTYSTSTPITKDEMLKMRQDEIKKDKVMRAYFKEQDELMRMFWKSFWR